MTEIQDGAQREKTASSAMLSRLFWGTIILLMGVTLGLALMAWLRAPDGTESPTPKAQTTDSMRPIFETGIRGALADLARKMEGARKDMGAAGVIAADFAYEDARKYLSEMLDEAYRPASNALPGYVDFHYSVLGEYAELAGAALGKSQHELQKRVFDGLSVGIQNAARKVDEKFDTAFANRLDTETAQLTPGNLPQEVQDAIATVRADLLNRVMVTAPVATAASTVAAIGGAKLASKAVAGKLAAKVTQKAALKLGGKWASVATGAGVGGLACSWSGPIAGACAVVAGGVTWFTVDHLVIKVDEYFTRADFEANLNRHIDAYRARTEALMLASLERKRDAMKASVTKTSSRMVSAADLGRDRVPELCQVAEMVLRDYRVMRTDLAARRPDKVQVLQRQIAGLLAEKATQEWAARVDATLVQKALAARVTNVTITGNLPIDLSADTELSGWLEIADLPVVVKKVEVEKARGFSSHLTIPELQIDAYQQVPVKLSLQQHRYLTDRYFVGSQTFSYPDILTRLRPGDGVQRYADLVVTAAQDTQANNLDAMNTGDGPAMNLSVRLSLSAAALPEMGLPMACL